MNTPDCIFCKFVNHEIPIDVVYEDEQFLIFLDINPVQKGHLLIIPKDHYRWIQDAPDPVIKDIFILSKKAISIIRDLFSCDFTQLVVEGNEVPHFHISIIPGYHGQPNAIFHHESYRDGEKEEYFHKIKSAF